MGNAIALGKLAVDRYPTTLMFISALIPEIAPQDHQPSTNLLFTFDSDRLSGRVLCSMRNDDKLLDKFKRANRYTLVHVSGTVSQVRELPVTGNAVIKSVPELVLSNCSYW